MAILHPFDPVADEHCTVLILGSFPSVKSRENGFYYGHPQNRFWSVLSAVYHEPAPLTNEAKKAFLLRHHIALWDVVASCEITGSSDASIKNVIPNDLTTLIADTHIETLIANGNTAYTLLDRFFKTDPSLKVIRLPSTSAANAAMTLERLTQRWSAVLKPQASHDDGSLIQQE